MGYKKVGLYITNGWGKPKMFYSFKCKKHGLVINYAKGYDGRLECPICEHEYMYKVKVGKE